MKNKSPIKISLNQKNSNSSSPKKSIKVRNNLIEEKLVANPFIKM